MRRDDKIVHESLDHGDVDFDLDPAPPGGPPTPPSSSSSEQKEPDIQEPRINLTFRYVKPQEPEKTPEIDSQVSPQVAEPVRKRNSWGVPDEVIEALKAELK